MRKPQIFQELIAKAHDMEVTIANCRDNSFGFVKLKMDTVEFKRNVEFSKNSTKEAMFISKAEPIQITRRPKLEEKMSAPFRCDREASHAKRTLREEVLIP